MTSAAATTPAAPDLQGDQRPRVLSLPDGAAGAGQEAVELAALAGLELDPWEQFVLRSALRERPDGKWAAFEVGLVVSRQNGKGAILEARELAGLFLLAEQLIIHSAHRFDTSLEAFRRLLRLIEETPDLDRRVQRVSHAHGEEGIELRSGERIRFRTRGAKGGGRGLTGDCLILDEAMDISTSVHGDLLPTLAARPNPQAWYTGSAVDQWDHENGIVLARLRERGHRGDDPSLAYFEWSVDDGNPEWVEEATAIAPVAWAQANPGLAIRISAEHIAREQRSMDPRTFAVERLGVGDWPSTNPEDAAVISKEKWAACADPDSRPGNALVFTFDVTPSRSRAAVAAAGRRADHRTHVEVIEHGEGTGWVLDRVEELKERHNPTMIACDESSPAASLLPSFEERGIEVTTLSAREHAQACGMFYDAVDQDQLRHLDTPELNAAVRGAATRPLSESWAWSRKNSTVDISPLVACTIAAWGVGTIGDGSVGIEW